MTTRYTRRPMRGFHCAGTTRYPGRPVMTMTSRGPMRSRYTMRNLITMTSRGSMKWLNIYQNNMNCNNLYRTTMISRHICMRYRRFLFGDRYYPCANMDRIYMGRLRINDMTTRGSMNPMRNLKSMTTRYPMRPMRGLITR